MFYVTLFRVLCKRNEDKFCFFVNKLNLLKSKVKSQSITFSIITQIFSVKKFNGFKKVLVGSVDTYCS